MNVNKPFIGTPQEIVIETTFPNISKPEFYTTKYIIKKTTTGYICKFSNIKIVHEKEEAYEMEAICNVPDEIINRFVNILRKGFKKYEYIVIDDGMFKIILTNELGEKFIYEDTYSGNHDELTSIIEELNNL